MRLKSIKLFVYNTMLVRVLTDIGGPKPVPLIARVIDERDNGYTIVYLSPSEERDHGRTVYRYEDDPYDIDDDYVVEYLDDEDQAGFTETTVGWIRNVYDSDDDYEPSDEEESLSDDDDDDDDVDADAYDEVEDED